MKSTNKLTVPDLITIGVFTALYFVLVTIATFSSVVLFPGFNNVILPAFSALLSGCVYMLLAAKLQKFGGISVNGNRHGAFLYDFWTFYHFFCCKHCNGDCSRFCRKNRQLQKQKRASFQLHTLFLWTIWSRDPYVVYEGCICCKSGSTWKRCGLYR